MTAEAFNPARADQDVTLTVTWGGLQHRLEIEAADWALILSGAGLELEGEDFTAGRDGFETEWDFAGGLDGALQVRFSRIDADDWRTGFSGILSDAAIAPAEA